MNTALLLICCLAPLQTPPAAPPAPAGAPAAAPALAPAPAQAPWPRLAASEKPPRVAPAKPSDQDPTPAALAGVVQTAAQRLVALQEGREGSEWPYEGVYRVRGQIPIGYRVGGTAIGALGLLAAPGYDADPARQQAVARATRLVCDGRHHPDMSEQAYQAGYDVRAWGYIYALHLLADLRSRKLVPDGLAQEVEAARAWYLHALQAVAMPVTGGWNYARPQGRASAGAPSSFMTASALQALFAAQHAGDAIDAKVVADGLGVLVASRSAQSGEVVYAGKAGRTAATGQQVPGATGRMCAVESTLALAGRADHGALERAVDALIEHWGELDKRRQMGGTHEPPFGVAPYYFMYAHRYGALAIEQLPPEARPARRERLTRLLLSVRGPDGTFNDRVFARSAGYGSAMAILALTQPGAHAPAWTAPGEAPVPDPALAPSPDKTPSPELAPPAPGAP